MTNRVVEESRSDAPTAQKIEEMYGLIEDIEMAMLTTVRTDGRLVSRPMSTQKRDSVADLWFMTDIDTNKLDEIEANNQVNLGYYNNKSREWVSVSGIARLSRDRALIARLYQPDWKAYLPEEGGERDGGPGDPRIVLILVDAESVVYMVSDKPKPVVLFEVLKAIATGSVPDIGKQRELSQAELDKAGD